MGPVFPVLFPRSMLDVGSQLLYWVTTQCSELPKIPCSHLFQANKPNYKPRSCLDNWQQPCLPGPSPSPQRFLTTSIFPQQLVCSSDSADKNTRTLEGKNVVEVHTLLQGPANHCNPPKSMVHHTALIQDIKLQIVLDRTCVRCQVLGTL